MPSITTPQIGKDWQLIHDPAISGDITALVTQSNGSNASLRISDTLPLDTDNGVSIGPGRIVTISELETAKLYGRSVDGKAILQLDENLSSQAFPAGAFLSNRAMTVQFYTEGNVKNGVEYEHSLHNDAVVAGGSLCFVMSIGSKPCLIKGVNLGIDGTEATYQIFRSPAFTGGVAGAIYNRNDRNPVPGETTIIDSPTVTNKGTPISAEFVFLGSSGQGQSNPVTGGIAGLDHLLAPNNQYLLCFENTGIETERLAIFASWYEGLTDLPRP